jgi:hypothetical protein
MPMGRQLKVMGSKASRLPRPLRQLLLGKQSIVILTQVSSESHIFVTLNDANITQTLR